MWSDRKSDLVYDNNHMIRTINQLRKKLTTVEIERDHYKTLLNNAEKQIKLLKKD